MRLLEYDGAGEIRLTSFFSSFDIPPYAILSHTWGPEEVVFHDLVHGTGKDKAGYHKVRFCGDLALEEGLKYFWVDTCCIDSSDRNEITEAINSMFRWYQNAHRCYVYLSDVSNPGIRHDSYSPRPSLDGEFHMSKWFTRGWLLQELLAPKSVEFFTREGVRIGSKASLEQQLHEITGIPVQALRGEPLSHFSIDERFSWAATRRTTRPEDQAYSLLGIFGVFLPLIYGEGKENAFRRLRHEIGSWEPPQDPLQLQPHYRALGEGRFRIMILNPGTAGSKIKAYLAEHDFLDPPEYSALSYTWGDEPPVHQIDLNYEPHDIPTNLFHALRRLRSPVYHVFLWVDFLCINQSDEAEKGTQVKRMADIYQKAKNVWIWLGEEDWKSKLVMKFIPQVNRHDFLWDELWWKRDEFIAFNHFLERPWFRRRWVIQEAAHSANSVILCGDRQVKMDDFVSSVRLVRQKLYDTPSSVYGTEGYSDDILINFRDSAATRLLDIISAAFDRSDEGDILRTYRRLSLEVLVDLSSFCETKKPQDAIFALLSLANDLKPTPNHHSRDLIEPDYNKGLLEVFAEFIMHCCRSGSLDIICRPWAPPLSSGTYTVAEASQFQEARTCSWLRPRDNFLFGNFSAAIAYQQHGRSLVRSSQKRFYNAHYGTMPQAHLGRTKNNAFNGSLYARGFIYGEISRRSMRMANGIISTECLNILRASPSDQELNSMNLPDTVWRTLCADRDNRGHPAPAEYRSRMMEILQLCPENVSKGAHGDTVEIVPSIDVEELLATELSEEVQEVLKVIRDAVWNRRTFKGNRISGNGSIVGLIPQHGKIGDQLCVLYGCSVPVVLRKQQRENGKYHWQLVGEAYIHGFMDGEAIFSLSPDERTEVEFEIR